MEIVIPIVIGMIVIAVVGVVIFDSNRFVIREYTVESDKLTKDYNFCVMSDLHCKCYGKNNSRLLNAVRNINADACLLPGDMITAAKGKSTKPAIEFISELAKIMPVYYSFGNHEYRTQIYTDVYGTMFADYEAHLNEAGVSLLNNEKVSFGETDIYSLSIDRDYYVRLKNVNMPSGYIESKLQAVDESRFSILLAHNPEYFEEYVGYGADLILSGHVHGGLVRLPFWGGMVSPKVRFFPKYDGGRFDMDNKCMIVSRGLGNHSIPIRFNNPGEIIVIHVKSC